MRGSSSMRSKNIQILNLDLYLYPISIQSVDTTENGKQRLEKSQNMGWSAEQPRLGRVARLRHEHLHDGAELYQILAISGRLLRTNLQNV